MDAQSSRPHGFEKRHWHELTVLPEPPARLARREVAPSRAVAIPPMRAGDRLAAGVQDVPTGYWREATYSSSPLLLFELRDALLHSSAGIVAAGRFIVADTMFHTLGSEHSYVETPDGRITLQSHGIRSLPGTAYSILAGGADNYYHWMLDGLARLAVLRDALRTEPGVLLVPPLGAAFRDDSLRAALDGVLPPERIVPVQPGETLLVERLVVPGTVTGSGWRVSPDIAEQFRSMASRAGQPMEARRLYIDRSRATHRSMRNEGELIEKLRLRGFVSTTLEDLSQPEQARLFADAEIVVGAHGAGLTNLLFAPPSCRVLEIHMSTYVNWCYLSLAAALGLTYDCVVASVSEADAAGVDIQSQRWDAPVDEVLQSVDALLG